MNFFDLFKSPDINAGIAEMENRHGAVLLDVRTGEEYYDGHIPGSVNIPLDELQSAGDRLPAKETPVYVHCYSGARSRRAALILKRLGYTNVTDIGGISNYNGKIERGAAV